MGFFKAGILGAVGAILAFTSMPQEAQAWGKFGHLTICDMAYRNLTEASRDKLKVLLHDEDGGLAVEGRGKMPDRYYSSFNYGCIEEDAMPRRNPADHFVNLPRLDAALTGPDCPLTGSCVMAGIGRDLAILADESAEDEDRVFAMFAIGHWLGDIHQPLHVSFADDRGGNRIDADVEGPCGTYSFKGKNLHSIWDNCLLDAGLFEKVRQAPGYSRKWSRFTITFRAVDGLQRGTSVADERIMVEGEPWEWAQESLAISLDPDVRYCVQVGDRCQYSADRRKYSKRYMRSETFDQAYLNQFKDVAEDRVRLAGFRLAHLLNGALDPNYTVPVKNTTQVD